MMTFWQGFDELTSIKVPSNVKILTTGAVAYQTSGYLGVVGYLLGSGIYRNLLPGVVGGITGKTKNTAPVNQVY